MAISILSQPVSPLESFTHHIWSVASDNANVRQIEARVFESGVLQFPPIRVQSSLGSTSAFNVDLQELLRDQTSFDLQDPAVTATAYTAPNSSYNYDAISFTELIDVNGKLELGVTNLQATSKTTVNAARRCLTVLDYRTGL